ncbi:MAG: roadblock/LC7 domain-containing protein [Acidiferrobacteraceae bacterium]|jgi:predicted regulator of Ras-like GTPase activity (Roadblock/LC7/MglB family)
MNTATSGIQQMGTEEARNSILASKLRSSLRALNGLSEDIEASAVISGDGLTLASVLGEDVDADRFGAMCASLLALAQRAGAEIARGELKQVLVEGDKGTMLLVSAGPDAVLAVATRPTINLGKIFIETRKIASKVEITILGG